MLTTGSSRVPRRGLWALLLAGTLLSLGVTALVATRAIVLGAPGAGWSYGYLASFHARTLTTAALVCAVCAVPILFVPAARTWRYECAAIALWIAVAMFAQLQLRGLTPYSLRMLFAAEGPNGTYQVSRQYDMATFVREFDRLRPALSSTHARSNMPGKIVFVQALELVSARPAVLAWLVVLLSNLGGVPLYFFVRDWLDDRDTALAALVFYLFVPARLLFFPLLNTVTPVFLLVCAWLWLRVLRRHEAIAAAALGVSGYWLAFFEPTPAVTGVLFATLTALALRRGEIAAGRALTLGAATVVAFAAVHVAMLAVFGFNLFSTLQTTARDAVAFNRLSAIPRPYGVWVGENLVEFFFGVGVCQTLLFGWSLSTARSGDARAAALAVGVAGTLAIVDLLGVNRGEVMRLWIFLACVVQVPAAHACARLGSRVALLLVVATSLVQTAVATSMIAFVRP